MTAEGGGGADPVGSHGKAHTDGAGAEPAEGATDAGHTTVSPESSEPLSEQAALAQLRGQSSSRPDVARSMEILRRRLKKLDEADLRVGNLYMFNGGVDVGGDLNAGTATPSSRSRSVSEPIDPRHIADYTLAYVTPAGFADALEVLRARHLLVLSGCPGTGRDAAAFALLKDVLGVGAAVCRMRSNAITRDDWSVPEPSTGYVVPDMTGSAAAQLDDSWLVRVGEQLRAQESYLVVLTGAPTGELALATKRASYVVESLAPPDPMSILTSRILHLGLVAEDEVTAQVAKWDVTRVLAERPRPRFAVQVAMAIADALTNGADVVAAVNRVSDPLGQVREWFTEHEEPDQIAWVVATAVLDESSYLTVSDGAVDLFTALAPEQLSPPPLRYRRRLSAEHPWIEMVRDPAGGPANPPVVRFRSSQIQPAVLDFAWNELDGMRPALQSWLRRMVAHEDVEVRARAAAAAGTLARNDFQYALHRFILPWAGGRSFVVRRSAALALSVVGADADHTERVWTLLRQWTSDVRVIEGKRLASTAGAVAGGPLGVDEPRRALGVLRDLIEQDDWRLLEPVVLSVFQLAAGGRSAEVLDALLDWTEDEDLSQLVVKGLTAFLFTVREQAVANAPEDAAASDWPLWLDESSTSVVAPEGFASTVSELWGRGLACRPTRSLAIEALREWVRVADLDARAYMPLLNLIEGIADRGNRDFERLHFHLDRWAADAADGSPAAGRLRDALSEPS